MNKGKKAFPNFNEKNKMIKQKFICMSRETMRSFDKTKTENELQNMASNMP